MTYRSPSCYIDALTAKVAAETGLPSDRYHLGKIILRSLKDAPDHILQIDGATDEKETFKSALERTTRCATAFRNMGLKYQDVIVIMAPNHIDLFVPMYASLYLGIMVAGVDVTFGVNKLQQVFRKCDPNVVFCQSSNVHAVKSALNLMNMPTRIITFDKNEDCMSFSKFLDKFGENTTIVDEFKPADFNTDETYAFLTTTSGSTGPPKTIALSHKNVIVGFPWTMTMCNKFPRPVQLALVISPVHWLSLNFVLLNGPMLRFTRLQTSLAPTPEHVYSLVNKYRPDYAAWTPVLLRSLLTPIGRSCDISSLRYIVIGGSHIANDIVGEIQKINSNLLIKVAFGMTETSGIIFDPSRAPFGSVGASMSIYQYRLVDLVTNEDINEPNTPGELRLKGATVFQGYYNNPQMTAAAFDADGWLKTGDIFYRDEQDNYYFCDRTEMMLKYRNQQVSPVEIETVIIKHPGVLDVAVTGVPDAESGDLPVAYVILRDGHSVTTQQIKDLVKETLTDTKLLRGGVVFVDEFPLTATAKVDRGTLKEWAKTLNTD